MTTPTIQRILYIEDEPDIRTIAKVALEAVGGFSVATCNSGPEAVAQAAALAPDLILLDVMMPGMDGPTTLAELRKQAALADTPVIFMTAKVQPQEIAQFKALGALDVITKPFDPMTLAQTIKTIWSRSTHPAA